MKTTYISTINWLCIIGSIVILGIVTSMIETVHLIDSNIVNYIFGFASCLIIGHVLKW